MEQFLRPEWVAIFLFAGGIKGLIGMGLPMISLALLGQFLDIPSAMALTLIPALGTNLWQASSGGEFRALVQRLWRLLLLIPGAIWLGAHLLQRVAPHWAAAVLGLLIVLYSLATLTGYRLHISAEQERRWGLAAGALNGLLTGITGTFSVPSVMYLQGVGLSRDQLVQGLGMIFSLSSLSLSLALGSLGLFTLEDAGHSSICLLSALLGMALGQRLRRYIPEPEFRTVFLSFLLLLGGALCLKPFLLTF